MAQIVRHDSSTADLWARMQEDIPDDVLAIFKYEASLHPGGSQLGTDASEALCMENCCAERTEGLEEAADGADGSATEEKESPLDEQSQGDMDIDHNSNVDDYDKNAWQAVNIEIAHLELRLPFFREDYNKSDAERSTARPALRNLPALTLDQIVYGNDMPKLDLDAWKHMLAHRQLIPTPVRYAASQADSTQNLKELMKTTWSKVFFPNWNLHHLYGEFCPSLGYDGEALCPLPVDIKTILKTAYLESPIAIDDNQSPWMPWGLRFKRVMIVGILVGLEIIDTGEISLTIKDGTGRCTVYFMISVPARMYLDGDNGKNLLAVRVGGIVQVIGLPFGWGPDHVHPTSIITTVLPKAVPGTVYKCHGLIADRITYVFSLYTQLRRVSVLNCLLKELFNDLLVTQEEFSTINDVSFNDDRVTDAIAIMRQIMRRLQQDNPVAEFGVPFVVKVALPRLALAKALAPEVIGAAIMMGLWDGWLGERVKNRILRWRCVEPLVEGYSY